MQTDQYNTMDRNYPLYKFCVLIVIFFKKKERKIRSLIQGLFCQNKLDGGASPLPLPDSFKLSLYYCCLFVELLENLQGNLIYFIAGSDYFISLFVIWYVRWSGTMKMPTFCAVVLGKRRDCSCSSLTLTNLTLCFWYYKINACLAY